MSQTSHSSQQDTEDEENDFPPVALINTSDSSSQERPAGFRPQLDKTQSVGTRISFQEPPPSVHTRRVSIQEPLPHSIHSRRVSIQEPLPSPTHTSRVSIQEPLPPSIHSRRVSIQEPLPPSIHSRRVSIQEPLPPSIHSRRVSIQEPLPPPIHSRRVSIQEPLPPSIHSRRVSIQEPQSPSIHSRRVSIQEPLPSPTHTPRVSIQEPLSPSIHSRRVSIQEPLPPPIHSRRVSIQEPLPPSIHSRKVSIQGPLPSPTYSRRDTLLTQMRKAFPEETSKASQSPQGTSEDMSTRRSLNTTNMSLASLSHWLSFQELSSRTLSHRFSGLDTPMSIFTSSTLLSHVGSVLFSSHESDQVTKSASSHSHKMSVQTFPIWARIEGTQSSSSSPLSSMKSLESQLWEAHQMSKSSMDMEELSESSLDNKFSLSASYTTEFHRQHKHRYSQLSFGWRLLHGAKKISRQLSLMLCLLGMVVLGLISLGQPWIHFNVPLSPPQAKDIKYIAINTVLFVQCPDTSCLHEYDQNAYLLDFAWAFLFIASLSSLCLLIILINIIFFTSSNTPMLDFSNVIISFLIGISIILSILFYLLQAREYLQEGMTYTLGVSFYLAWSGVFFFLFTGIFSYLNYMNFWSILALHAIWV